MLKEEFDLWVNATSTQAFFDVLNKKVLELNAEALSSRVVGPEHVARLNELKGMADAFQLITDVNELQALLVSGVYDDV